MHLSPADRDELRHARRLLEKPSLAARIIKVMGVPFEQGLRCLPDAYVDRIQAVCEKALRAALDFAVRTLDSTGREQSSDQFHQIAAAISGGIGGAIGLPALAIELPVSTTIMMRSIADIAREEGEDISLIDTKLACLMVFALSGKTERDALETGYYGIRAALSAAMSDATSFIAERGLTDDGTPILMRLITKIAARFGLVVSEKAAATAIPIVGAAGGMAINTLFINHFQNMARGHFIIRRLERVYGREAVKAAYETTE